MNLGRYRRSLDSVMQSLLREILSTLIGVYRPTDDEEEREEMVARLAPGLTQSVRVARNRAHRVAVQQLIDSAPGDRLVYIPDQRGYAQDSVERVLRSALRGPAHSVATKVSSTLVRHAEQAARDTIVDAALDKEWKPEKDPEKDSSRGASEQESTPREEAPAEENSRERPGRSRLKIDFGKLFDEDEDLQDDLDEAMQQQRAEQRPIGWARIMTGAETCAFCVMLASRPGAGERRFYTSADAAGGELAKAEYRGTAMFVNRYHDNCVVPGTLVDGPPADVGYRRAYHGEVVHLRTAAGKNLSVTPNHPVLTDRGWVPAGLLNEGDHLVSAPLVDGKEGRGPDEGHAPARIEDAFRALQMVARSLGRAVPGSPEYFHGDGGESEVNVVDINDLLGDRFETTGSEPFAELDFDVTAPSGAGKGLSRDRLSALQLGRTASGASAGGIVRGLSLSATLLGGHLGCPVHTSRGTSASGDPSFIRRTKDPRSRETGLGGQRERGFTLAVPLQHLGRDVQPTVRAVRVTRKFDPAFLYSHPDGLTSYSELGADLLERFAGAVELDRLVDKSVGVHDGEVLNLSTVEGWYSANGITVSNCDCVVVPVYDENNWIGREQADYLYEHVYLKALGGKPAEGWRSNKYSENDVVKMIEKWLKEHAEEYQLPQIREMV